MFIWLGEGCGEVICSEYAGAQVEICRMLCREERFTECIFHHARPASEKMAGVIIRYNGGVIGAGSSIHGKSLAAYGDASDERCLP